MCFLMLVRGGRGGIIASFFVYCLLGVSLMFLGVPWCSAKYCSGCWGFVEAAATICVFFISMWSLILRIFVSW